MCAFQIIWTRTKTQAIKRSKAPVGYNKPKYVDDVEFLGGYKQFDRHPGVIFEYKVVFIKGRVEKGWLESKINQKRILAKIRRIDKLLEKVK